MLLNSRRSVYGYAAALVLVLASLDAADAAPPAAPTGSNSDSIIAEAVAKASHRFAIPPAWIRAVIQVESSGSVGAISPKGAMGLMQIMPATWQAFRLRYHLGSDPYDAHDNILAGTALLRELYDRFGSSGFLAAYNAGPLRYLDHLMTGAPLKAETQLYLAKLAALLPSVQIEADLSAPAAPRDWHSAPLFAAAWQSSDNASGASSAPPQPTTDIRSSRPSPNDTSKAISSHLEPAAAGLFAALSPAVTP